MIDWISHNAGMIGLLFFFGFFVTLLLWLCRPGAKTLAEGYSRIPLKEDD